MNASVPEATRTSDAKRWTVAQKMGIKTGSRAYLAGAPPAVVQSMRLPPLIVSAELSGQFDYLHLFATSQVVMSGSFSTLAEHLVSSGSLWVSWPKARQLDTDLTLTTVIKIGYSRGMVESTCLSVDSTWSALKFTHPKPGKIYNNSHGTLTPPG